jgi:hypothetical protein
MQADTPLQHSPFSTYNFMHPASSLRKSMALAGHEQLAAWRRTGQAQLCQRIIQYSAYVLSLIEG